MNRHKNDNDGLTKNSESACTVYKFSYSIFRIIRITLQITNVQILNLIQNGEGVLQLILFYHMR